MIPCRALILACMQGPVHYNIHSKGPNYHAAWSQYFAREPGVRGPRASGLRKPTGLELCAGTGGNHHENLYRAGGAQVGYLWPTGFTPPTGLAVAPTLKAFFIQPPRGLKPANCRAVANLTGVSSLVIQSPFCTSVGQYTNSDK